MLENLSLECFDAFFRVELIASDAVQRKATELFRSLLRGANPPAGLDGQKYYEEVSSLHWELVDAAREELGVTARDLKAVKRIATAPVDRPGSLPRSSSRLW